MRNEHHQVSVQDYRVQESRDDEASLIQEKNHGVFPGIFILHVCVMIPNCVRWLRRNEISYNHVSLSNSDFPCDAT